MLSSGGRDSLTGSAGPSPARPASEPTVCTSVQPGLARPLVLVHCRELYASLYPCPTPRRHDDHLGAGPAVRRGQHAVGLSWLSWLSWLLPQLPGGVARGGVCPRTRERHLAVPRRQHRDDADVAAPRPRAWPPPAPRSPALWRGHWAGLGSMPAARGHPLGWAVHSSTVAGLARRGVDGVAIDTSASTPPPGPAVAAAALISKWKFTPFRAIGSWPGALYTPSPPMRRRAPFTARTSTRPPRFGRLWPGQPAPSHRRP